MQMSCRCALQVQRTSYRQPAVQFVTPGWPPVDGHGSSIGQFDGGGTLSPCWRMLEKQQVSVVEFG
jgi:hypothetical protein